MHGNIIMDSLFKKPAVSYPITAFWDKFICEILKVLRSCYFFSNMQIMYKSREKDGQTLGTEKSSGRSVSPT